MQFANIFVEKFSGKQRWKEYQKYLQKFEKMRIGGEFWARLVLKHEAYKSQLSHKCQQKLLSHDEFWNSSNKKA